MDYIIPQNVFDVFFRSNLPLCFWINPKIPKRDTSSSHHSEVINSSAVSRSVTDYVFSPKVLPGDEVVQASKDSSIGRDNKIRGNKVNS